ncbi:hypothetical protein GCM10028803_00380 [Larkinella knui]|uniref:Uncharacterized protein n=1 Tax=Larkinella knui TaxID=2025310 RepID=A0A3P1CKL3_9BACT|nr:hypothetical protein [Larkinella knui]RRB13444.1 hypothetical protein EHT87_14300 [Larkinella knui]
MKVFDLSFDHTFGLVLDEVTPSETACRKPGVYLYWLSPTGWAGWLFEAFADSEKEVRALGSFRQAGLTRYTQKESAEVLTIRTRHLKKWQAEAIATVFESVAVFVLVHDDQDVTHKIPVEVPTGSFPVWKDANRLGRLEGRITLPARRSQRA